MSAVEYAERCVPLGLDELFARMTQLAADIGLIPLGTKELEFNISNDRILSIEYWSETPRTDANHTEVPIPERHQSMFDRLGDEFMELVR